MAVPGNTPPAVSSFGHVPEIAEALRDTFTFNLSAVDADGSLERVVLDFGDGSNPVTLSGGLLGGAIQHEHVFPEEGSYVVRAIVYDDDGVAVEIRDTVEALPPNQLPTGSLTLQGDTEGDAPLAVRIQTSGSDRDGQIVKWELDTDQGDGYEVIQPNETVQVSYAYQEDPYVPKLRLTDDDGDASVIEADDEILVFRQIDAGESNVAFQGNPAFDSISIAPAIWADGEDAFEVSVVVRDPEGAPLEDVPLDIDVTRARLIAPDGADLGIPVSLSPANPRTDAQGRVTVLIRTNTSTRVESAPDLGFVPFDLVVRADRGHGQMVDLEQIGEDVRLRKSLGEARQVLPVNGAALVGEKARRGEHMGAGAQASDGDAAIVLFTQPGVGGLVGVTFDVDAGADDHHRRPLVTGHFPALVLQRRVDRHFDAA